MTGGRQLLRSAALAATLVLSSHVAVATTWAPVEQPCPLCGAENRVWHVLSGGGYVYTRPSKYQLVFWPFIDEQSLFTCRHCGLTVFMCDLEALPADRHAAIRSALPGLDRTRLYVGDDPAPIVERLPIAARVYEAWGRDAATWCHFHRVAGYHYAAAGMNVEAAASRRRALEYAGRLLRQGELEGTDRRELWVASAAMRQPLGEDVVALRDLGAALLARRSSDPEQHGRHSYLLRLTLLLAARNTVVLALGVAGAAARPAGALPLCSGAR
jgi:hypothetical protein